MREAVPYGEDAALFTGSEVKVEESAKHGDVEKEGEKERERSGAS